jgi:hypothetical protein
VPIHRLSLHHGCASLPTFGGRLEILPNPRIGTFWKEDSEVIKRDRGLWPDGSIRTTRAESTALVNGETLELSAVAFTGVIGIAHDGNS